MFVTWALGPDKISFDNLPSNNRLSSVRRRKLVEDVPLVAVDNDAKVGVALRADHLYTLPAGHRARDVHLVDRLRRRRRVQCVRLRLVGRNHVPENIDS